MYADSCFPLEHMTKNSAATIARCTNAFETVRTQFFDKNKSEGKVCMTCLLEYLAQ